ncbi:MAG: bifunctional (p)ppGpp synthetase/guanosine-3',5'-bis(diphosphate) 3'-pyrophosphohydrolase, partial [Desulfovibrionaceae bacterium]|nr:bifunctional (p)ppGpp synthetase/guanosine-3',5'-bis(diphosphate) 3'-pyrophosphohydrolase [Desulfovibrionaceae bacterium]
VKTAKARSYIQRYLRTEERAHAVRLGHELLEKEGRKLNLNTNKALKDGHFVLVAQDLKFDSVEDLVASVGYGHITSRRVLNRLYGVMHPESQTQTTTPTITKEAPKETPHPKTDGVSVAGIDGVLMRFAKCCNPVPGDSIIGYISRGVGITIHRSDCPNVANMEIERLISVNWDGQEEKPYETGMVVISKNEKGVLAGVSTIIAKYNVNICGLVLETYVDGRAKLNFRVEVRNVTELYKMIEEIRKMPEILEVIREREGDDI